MFGSDFARCSPPRQTVKLLVKSTRCLDNTHHVLFCFMRTKMSKRWQIYIPSDVRKQLQIHPNTIMEWIIEGTTARVIPVPEDPTRAFRGSGKKGLVKQLLKERRRDRQNQKRLSLQIEVLNVRKLAARKALAPDDPI